MRFRVGPAGFPIPVRRYSPYYQPNGNNNINDNSIRYRKKIIASNMTNFSLYPEKKHSLRIQSTLGESVSVSSQATITPLIFKPNECECKYDNGTEQNSANI